MGRSPTALPAYLPATFSLPSLLQAFRPDIVISTGTAGGFRAKGAQIADVFVSTGMANHDRRIPLPVRCGALCGRGAECSGCG